MSRLTSIKSGLVLSALVLGIASTAGATEFKLANHIEKITIKGDLRLRQENLLPKEEGQVGRSRTRYRLRLSTDFSLPDHLTAKFRFASGVGEQTSTNQSLDNLSSQDNFWIDQAYLVWKPLDGVTLQGGRMSLPLWTTYSSDIVWDSDFNPGGFGLMTEHMVPGANLFANAMYMVADERSNNNQGTDKSEVSFQLGGEVKLPANTRLKAALAQHQWINERAASFGGTDVNNPAPKSVGGNRGYTNNGEFYVTNEYRTNEITADFSFWVLENPVHILGTFINNVDALDPYFRAELGGVANTGFAAGQKKGDKGHQYGVIIGKAQEKGSWEVAYFQKKAEIDCTFDSVADADFPGTGRKGNIFWGTYALNDFTTVGAKYFTTQYEDKMLTPGGGTSATLANKKDLLQVDLVLKF